MTGISWEYWSLGKQPLVLNQPLCCSLVLLDTIVCVYRNCRYCNLEQKKKKGTAGQAVTAEGMTDVVGWDTSLNGLRGRKLKKRGGGDQQMGGVNDKGLRCKVELRILDKEEDDRELWDTGMGDEHTLKGEGAE